MFGYVRPALDRLSPEQKQLYQSAYCGLCHTMGVRHGFWARFTLNYDLTLLAILLQGGQAHGRCTTHRCPAHPLRKVKPCLEGMGMEQAADMSLILTWYKLDDDVRDHGCLSGLPYRLARSWFSRAYRKAAQRCPNFDLQVRQGLQRLTELEEERSPHLDETAHQFATILASAAQELEDAFQSRVLYQLFYHVGRWIYLMDAWDDLDEDEAQGRYNPLHQRFQGHAKQEREYIATTCSHSIRLSVNAARLLDLGPWSPVVENILCIGMPSVQNAVLEGRWKELKTRHKGRYLHERSV